MSVTNVEKLKTEAIDQLNSVDSPEKLESFRIEYLGKKGKLQSLMGVLKEIPVEERRAYGQSVNAVKQTLQELFEAKRTECQEVQKPVKNAFDSSLPPLTPKTGRIHPITQTIFEICDIFERMGFQIADGPEIESEFHNFTALNIPLDHPSRDAFDTFYTENNYLLRSQTSTVQIRVMEKSKPPLRIIAPGRVYRPDTVDASHSFMFHQIEGLLVDEGTTFSELKGILHVFLKELFGERTQLRFRPHFFPFTEPSVEVDIQWGKKGWLEILGAGCVDPNVFKAVGYDAKKVKGFAFGLGVERIAMMKHGIQDIRHFYENDVRFLNQF